MAAHILDMVGWYIIIFVLVAPLAVATHEASIIGFFLLIGLLAVQILLWANSTSLGKWMLGMKVYHMTGAPLGFFGMLIRETIGKFISGLLFGLGYLWILIDRQHQGWHDKLLSSLVVKNN